MPEAVQVKTIGVLNQEISGWGLLIEKRNSNHSLLSVPHQTGRGVFADQAFRVPVGPALGRGAWAVLQIMNVSGRWQPLTPSQTPSYSEKAASRGLAGLERVTSET